MIHFVSYREKDALDCSTVAASRKIVTEGFDSWKPHFMDLVDEFRRKRDP